LVYIATGAFSFLMIALFDIVSLKRIPRIKLGIWVLGIGLFIYSIVMVSLAANKISMPPWTTWIGYGLLAISVVSLGYCLFINLPFRKTYITTGAGDKLITTGLYALVRHPGVHILTLVLLSLFLISKSVLLLIAAPIWVLLNILLVVIQDKFIFGKMFDEYDDYRQKTPMLMPNRRSAMACLHSLKQSKPIYTFKEMVK